MKTIYIYSVILSIHIFTGCQRPNPVKPYNKGVKALAASKYQEAADYFEKAVTIHPRFAQAWLNLGTAMARKKPPNYREAQKAYMTAIREWRDKKSRWKPYNNLAWLYSSAKRKSFRRAKEAIKYAKRAVELTFQENANCLHTLARAYTTSRRYIKAIKTIKKAIEVDDRIIYRRFLRKLNGTSGYPSKHSSAIKRNSKFSKRRINKKCNNSTDCKGEKNWVCFNKSCSRRGICKSAIRVAQLVEREAFRNPRESENIALNRAARALKMKPADAKAVYSYVTIVGLKAPSLQQPAKKLCISLKEIVVAMRKARVQLKQLLK